MHAVYGNFPYVLLFVVLLTYVLLARAFRSLLLPLKAVVLNLVSLGAAYGIVVSSSSGSRCRGDLERPRDELDHPVDPVDDLRLPLRPLDGLRGLHAHAHAGAVRRIGETSAAISHGLTRTGKLVTSAALVRCLAFFVLSTSPGTDIKQFGIGLSAGVVFDAPVIRALLVPSLMHLLGRWNWVFPHRVAKVLLTDAAPAPVD